MFAIYEFAGFIISASDDKTVKVWNNDTCIDTILHPNSIFSIVCTWDNDIVTACGDCYTRVFTKNEQRMANLDIIDKFNKNVEDSHKPMTANDFSDAPSIE